LPGIQFNTALRVVRGARVFLGLKLGFTRGATPMEREKVRDQELETCREQVQEQQESLENKTRQLKRRDRRISRLRENATELKNARKQVSQQRKTLRLRSQEIEQLRMELSVGGITPTGESKSLRPEEDPNSGSLPDFLIIGAQKTGTTFLYYLLCQHPYVAPTSEKELHYFDTQKFGKGIEWYRSNFPPPSSRDGQRIITGEASPYYLYHPLAAKRAAQVVPQAKLIALLRNPVDRAYSDYQNRLREGNEFLSFEEAMEAEEERIGGEREKILADENYLSRNHRRYSYLARGVYVDQLREWHERFGRERVLVIRSEDFFEHPQRSVEEVLGFLELPAWKPEILSANLRNESDYDPMSPVVRERLESYFEPHNRRLYEYLGIDFGW
jgi:hypothetical protein